jgi:hypothetical protein
MEPGLYWRRYVENLRANYSGEPDEFFRSNGNTDHFDHSYGCIKKDTIAESLFDAYYTLHPLIPKQYRFLAEESRIGRPAVALFGGIPMSVSSLEFAYMASRIDGYLGQSSGIVDIGGGYGGLAAALAMLGHNIVIVDFPELHRIQAHYLRKRGRLPMVEFIRAGDDAMSADAYVSTRSLCEMDTWQAHYYRDMIERNCTRLFYSVNKKGAACNISSWQPNDGWRLIFEAPFPYKAKKHWREWEMIWEKKRVAGRIAPAWSGDEDRAGDARTAFERV